MKLPGLKPGVSFAPKSQLRLILPSAQLTKKTPFSCARIPIHPWAKAQGIL